MKYLIYGGSMTIFMAFLLSLFIYCILKKYFLRAFLMGISGTLIFIFNYKWLAMKFLGRPYVWAQMIQNIQKHPIKGNGFCEYLWGNMEWVSQDNYGWIYRHNDFLGIGDYLGIPVIIFIIWFVIETFKRVGIRPLLIPILMIAIMCNFQMTMFFCDRAMICIIIISLILSQTIENKGEMA